MFDGSALAFEVDRANTLVEDAIFPAQRKQQVDAGDGSSGAWHDKQTAERVRRDQLLLKIQRMWNITLCVVFGAFHVLCHVVGHLPLLKAVGLVPACTGHQPCSVVARVVMHIAVWLSGRPSAIDIVHRLAYTFFFLASGRGVLGYLCGSYVTRFGGGSSVIERPLDRTIANECYWFAVCLLLLFILDLVTVINVALYVLIAVPGMVSVMGAWGPVDMAFYAVQGCLTVLLSICQWCALGGVNGYIHILSRLRASHTEFFKDLVRMAGRMSGVWFMLWIMLLSPLCASWVWEHLETLQPVIYRASGCRLSGLSLIISSWYVCTSLGNHQLHLRILWCLGFLLMSSLSSLLCGIGCWNCVVPSSPCFSWLCSWLRELSLVQWLSAHAQSLSSYAVRVIERQLGVEGAQLADATGGLCQIVIPTLQSVFNGQLPVDLYEPAVSKQFAVWWWVHTLLGYLGMCLFGSYCIMLVGINAMQMDPFAWRYEQHLFFVVGVCHLSSRWITGLSAARLIGAVKKQPHQI